MLADTVNLINKIKESKKKKIKNKNNKNDKIDIDIKFNKKLKLRELPLYYIQQAIILFTYHPPDTHLTVLCLKPFRFSFVRLISVFIFMCAALFPSIVP